jgi:Putative peptidoglycan binding domain
MASPRLIERLRAENVLRPQAVVEEARRAGLRLPLACALLEKESGGGRNVFGHDPTIFVGAGEVTRAKYAEYKRRRVASGNRQMQGVGPCQLTWWEFQDTADREGGCWRPEINMRVGFRHLVALMKQHGEAEGARRYNGSGPAAEAYSRDLIAKARIWDAKLSGLPVPAGASAGPRLVRRGDEGKLVERITARLSRVRSRATGRPYLDGARRRFDREAEEALKEFQREHRLDPDGVFGRASAQALNRAVELERKRGKTRPKISAPTTQGKPSTTLPKGSDPPPGGRPRVARPGLPALVGAVRRGDAQTDRSWQELAAYGSRRRRLLEELRGKGVDLGDLATVLLRIEDKLEALVEIEQAEAAAADEPPPPRQADAPAPEPVASGAVPAEAPAEADASTAAAIPAAPPAPPAHATNGAPPQAPATDSPRRKIGDLSDAELERRVERLDRAIGVARAALIARYARTEKELMRLLPKERQAPRPRPPRQRGGGSPRPRGDGQPQQVTQPRPRPGPRALPQVPRRPRHKPTNLTRAEVRRLQKALNRFTERYLEGVGPLMVDGVKGPATGKRIAMVKYHLGYTGKAQRSATVKPAFARRLRHVRSPRWSSPAMLTRAAARRAKQRKRAKVSSAPKTGVATFDGRPVAAWMKPYLDWARQNGWKGTLNSGYRDPAHSERVCMEICGAPSCPGRCAGRSSNHSGSSNPSGAIDVSDYVTFGRLMQRCPYSPRLFNALGASDPVHFSATGR